MSLIRYNRAAAVSSDTKQFDQESGENISDDLKQWKKHEGRSKTNAREKQAIELKKARILEEKKERDALIKEEEVKRKMLRGLEDYLEKTKHITEFATNVLGYPPDEYEILDQRRKWILTKHKEWELKVWFESDHPSK